MGRAIGAMWMAMGISLFVLLMSLGFSGRADRMCSWQSSAAMLGMANAASSIILKWKMQFACAVVWWAGSGGGDALAS